MEAATEHPAFGRAVAALHAGRTREAEDLFKLVLTERPKHLTALNLLSVLLTRHGRFADAEVYLCRALQVDSSSAVTLQNYAIVLQASHRPVEALERFSQALRINSNDAETWNRRGLTLCALQRFDQAGQDFDHAIEINPGYAEAYCNKGKALATLGRTEDALPAFDRAIALEPNFADAWYCRGNACNELKRNDEARAAFDRVLALQPDRAEAWLGRANACFGLDLHDAAIAAYEKALVLNPHYAEAHNNRATVLLEIKQYGRAIAGFERSLQLKPNLADAWLGLGASYYEISEFDKSHAAYEKALALNPGLVKAWVGRGNIDATFKRYNEALTAFDKASELDPNYIEVWIGRAEALAGMGRLDAAIGACDHALKLAPELGYVFGARLSLKLLACDWTNLDIETDQLGKLLRRQELASGGDDASASHRVGRAQFAQPLGVARLIDDSSVLHACAVNWTHAYASHPPRFEHQPRKRGGKIRLGYLSPDFGRHVTGFGIVEMLEKHDRGGFTLHGLSLARDDGSAIRRRIAGAFDQFEDLSRVDDETAARHIYSLGLDLVVEIAPLSRGSRPAILAHRPAPIQVNYGPPGYSTGATFMDYIIADEWTLPPSDRRFFTEKVAYIPNSWFAHDATVAISPTIPTKSDEGLPDNGFVFCCFNTSYKITPEFFAIWMRLLHAVDGSVLWLARNNVSAVLNLRCAARDAGIDPDRLIFAEVRPDIADHLARHRLADLFLDTLPYNAQTTAMDALWAGLPVLTCAGRSFAGRTAVSILYSMDLPELVTADTAAYERLAIELARDPWRLSRLRAKVKANRTTTPLFDTGRLCRELEFAYATMVDIYWRGESPRSFGAGTE